MCDVVGCTRRATAVYLHALDMRVVEFRICDGHYREKKLGKRPVVVNDAADRSARLALTLEWPSGLLHE